MIAQMTTIASDAGLHIWTKAKRTKRQNNQATYSSLTLILRVFILKLDKKQIIDLWMTSLKSEEKRCLCLGLKTDFLWSWHKSPDGELTWRCPLFTWIIERATFFPAIPLFRRHKRGSEAFHSLKGLTIQSRLTVVVQQVPESACLQLQSKQTFFFC